MLSVGTEHVPGRSRSVALPRSRDSFGCFSRFVWCPCPLRPEEPPRKRRKQFVPEFEILAAKQRWFKEWRVLRETVARAVAATRETLTWYRKAADDIKQAGASIPHHDSNSMMVLLENYNTVNSFLCAIGAVLISEGMVEAATDEASLKANESNP